MGDVKPKILSCVFNDAVLCSYRKTEEFGIMDRCFDCSHHVDFIRFNDEQDAVVMDEINEVQRKEDFSCPCDHKPCDNEIVGSCFSKSSNDFLLWVCPRFNVDCFSDDAMIKVEFLRLRKGGLV